MIKFLINLASFLWIIILFIFSANIFDNICLNILCLVMVIVLNFIIFWSLKWLIKRKIGYPLETKKIYPIYSKYTSSYFATCVAVFSMGFLEDIGYIEQIFIVIFLFIIFYINNIGYLNPFLFFCKIRVYKVEAEQLNYIVIVAKNKQLKNVEILEELVKIDEYTFIQKETK